jgi:DNA uptake protein ComE-like DNA-binding protein
LTRQPKQSAKLQTRRQPRRSTPAELKSIPGIGDAYSAAIVKGRPYANKAQLKSKGIVPDGVYEKIKDKIIAKQ